MASDGPGTIAPRAVIPEKINADEAMDFTIFAGLIRTGHEFTHIFIKSLCFKSELLLLKFFFISPILI